MKSPKRGRTNRVVDARLPFFLASPLPEVTKTRVAAIVAELLAMRATDPTAVILPHMLIELQCLLDVSTLVVADLLHVLCQGEPHCSGHTRRGVGALLRAKRSQLQRCLTSSDYLPNHPVQLFTCAYWGGINAWSDGAPGKAQRLKGS